MSRRVWEGLALAVACVIAIAGTAQAGQESGTGPEAEGPGWMMEMPGPGGMEPGEPPMGGAGPMMGMRGPGPREWERLGLTGAQRQRLEELRDVEERKVIRLEADLRIAELDLWKLVAGERPDLRAIGGQVDRIADLRAGVMKAHLATRLGLRQVLTPDQRTRLRDRQPGERPEGAAPARRRQPKGR